MAENQMHVSDLGILNVNRKIADITKYDKELIETIGEDLKFDNNSVSNFSETSYLYKSDLTFSDSPLTIKMSGTYHATASEQVAWFLAGTNPEINNIILQFNENQISLVIDSRVIVKFPFLGLTDTVPFKSITEISNNSCRLTIYLNGTLYDKTIELAIPTNLSLLNKLYIGNDPTDLTEYWQDSLNVGEFTISNKDQVVYTPSVNFPLKLSKVLISDRELGPLTDTSVPVARHIVEIPINEVSRSNSAILFTTTLGEDIRIIIREIALYYEGEDGSKIFCNIGGLNINKGFNVPYDLIFTLNLSVNFLNVTGFPDVNSFYLEEFRPALFKDFKTIQEVTTYAITNLERLIRMNAQNIGYNKAQIFYMLQQEFEREQDCYSNIQSFSKLMKRLQIEVEKIFSSDNLQSLRDSEVVISDDGVAQNFSLTNYLCSYWTLEDLSNWKIDTSFTLNRSVEENQPETFASFVYYYENNESSYEEGEGITYSSVLPVELGVNRINNKNYCFIKIRDIDGNYIIDEPELFQALLWKKYYVRVYYKDNTYNISFSENGKEYQLIKSISSTDEIAGIGVIFIGTRFDSYDPETDTTTVSQPFSSGSLDLFNWTIETPYSYWENYESIITRNTELSQYYRIPDLFQSTYQVTDLCHEDNNISILENSFQGNKDLINFHNRDGFTLNIKVNLKDAEPKILLAKTNMLGDPYFVLSFLNQTLKFTIYLENGETVSLLKEIPRDDLASFIREPVLISVILDYDQNFSLYRNNELLDIYEGLSGPYKDYSQYSLTNSITDNLLTELCREVTDYGDFTFDEYVTKVKENQGRYVQNIVGITGTLNSNDLYYINNLMDTNY